MVASVLAISASNAAHSSSLTSSEVDGGIVVGGATARSRLPTGRMVMEGGVEVEAEVASKKSAGSAEAELLAPEPVR